jgi:hypothetical protein
MAPALRHARVEGDMTALPGSGGSVAPTIRQRMLAALLIGLVTGLGAYVYSSLRVTNATDFDQCWIAARALLAGHDPYQAVRASGWPWPLYYPLPAIVLVAPVALLHLMEARAVFVGAGAALLAFGITESAWHPLLLFVSGLYFETFQLAQWSPLLIGAALVPALSWMLVAKPNLGLALFAARPSWMAPVGGFVLIVATLLLWPTWPREWLAASRSETHLMAPVVLLGGPIALLALLRWRRPEGRLVAVLACVPQTVSLHASLALFLVPRTRMESLVLTLGADVAFLLLRAAQPFPSLVAQERFTGYAVIALLYLPCVIMLLRRPNEGPIPSWLARAVAHVPGRRRGVAGGEEPVAPSLGVHRREREED